MTKKKMKSTPIGELKDKYFGKEGTKSRDEYEEEKRMIMKNKCEHSRLIKISHWWFRFKCEDCGKRFRRLPKGNWFIFGE